MNALGVLVVWMLVLALIIDMDPERLQVGFLAFIFTLLWVRAA